MIDWRHLSRKPAKAVVKAGLPLPLPLDQLGQALADVGHPLLELGDGLFPGCVGRRAIAEKALQRLDEPGRFGQVDVQGQTPVLPEDGALRGLEEDVVARVAGRELALNFGWEVVVDVLGLPVAVGETKVVNERPVDDDAFAAAGVEGVFGHEGPAALAGAVFEEGLEGGADGGFVGDAEVCKPVERGVIVFDGLVRGFKVESGHRIAFARKMVK